MIRSAIASGTVTSLKKRSSQKMRPPAAAINSSRHDQAVAISIPCGISTERGTGACSWGSGACLASVVWSGRLSATTPFSSSGTPVTSWRESLRSRSIIRPSELMPLPCSTICRSRVSPLDNVSVYQYPGSRSMILPK